MPGINFSGIFLLDFLLNRNIYITFTQQNTTHTTVIIQVDTERLIEDFDDMIDRVSSAYDVDLWIIRVKFRKLLNRYKDGKRDEKK